MADDGYIVDPDGMRAHAKKVDAAGDRLGTAADAAGQMTLHNEAFGLIGQPLAAGVMVIEGVATGAVAASRLMVEGVAAGIKAMADAYDEVEHAKKQAFGGN
ncbi:type VII secretion target [Actinocrispum wychmicini]|uniref:Excreted virulence factor EspC (Type VII ESX diderm) n=1 Tax=Actinocrispum wychmicini TaxID=1213861 RepID=A0A4R2KGU5_9PSEU|nr:type VII secretion target [Actinocrispum wychmicini]TCO65665.1 excreted virulence factor EspC (type VII ESX diderm) [Actinocrispum wychmicini]